ncbi:MAG: hypothetical protein PHQ40_01405 [Anaerolineaceae bacterium]|nr:hypothetical protein [Anaerolineaceae bacterium]
MENPSEVKHAEDPYVREARKHVRSARSEMRKSVEAWLPPGVLEHRRAARREFLLAVRSLLNAAIGRIDQPEPEEPTRES